MNIHLPASLVFTKIVWCWPIPNPFLGTTSAVACHVVVGDAPADDFWMKWAFCFNVLIIVCYTPYISWIIMIHELGIPIIWMFHCFFHLLNHSFCTSTNHLQTNSTSWVETRADRGSIWTGEMWPQEIWNKAMRWSSSCASRCHSVSQTWKDSHP